MSLEELLKLGRSQLLTNSHDDALLTFNRALEIEPDSARAATGRGLAYGGLGKLKSALADYDRALELDSDEVEVHLYRGHVLNDLGQYELASIAFTKALDLEPASAYAHFGWGNVLKGLGKPEEALTAYDKSLKLNPNYVFAHNGRGQILYDLGRPEQALDAFDRELQLEPSSVNEMLGKGNALSDLGRFQEALLAYDRALNLDANSLVAHTGRGDVLQELHRFNEASDAYSRALQLDPNYVYALNGRGNLFAEQERFRDAVDVFLFAIQIAPNFRPPYFNLAHCYRKLHSIHAAVPYVNRFVLMTSGRWTGSHQLLLPLPLLALRNHQQFGVPPNETLNPILENQIQKASNWLGIASYAQHTGYEVNEVTINRLLGDEVTAFQLANAQFPDAPTSAAFVTLLTLSERCLTPLAPELLALGKQTMESQLPERSSGFSKLLGLGKKLSVAEAVELYYAGLAFRLLEEPTKSLRCFEAAARSHPPARFAHVALLFQTRDTTAGEKALAKLLTEKALIHRLGKGYPRRKLTSAGDFTQAITDYQEYLELRWAMDTLALRTKRTNNPLVAGKNLPPFWECHEITKEFEQKISDHFRSQYLRRYFETFYEQELRPAREQLTEALDTEEILREVNTWKHSRAGEIFERLTSLPQSELANAIGQYFSFGELTADQATAALRYFVSQGHIAEMDFWLLNFYIGLRERGAPGENSDTVDAGLGKVLEEIVQNPLGYSLTATAGASSYLVGASIDYTITTISSVGATMLAHAALKSWQRRRSAQPDFAGFKVSFREHIAEERERLGKREFWKQYPVAGLVAE